MADLGRDHRCIVPAPDSRTPIMRDQPVAFARVIREFVRETGRATGS